MRRTMTENKTIFRNTQAGSFYYIQPNQPAPHMRQSFLLFILAWSMAAFAQHPAATIAEYTRDMKKFDGFYPFYYDDKTGKVFLELARWNEEFLYFSSLPEGIGNGGAERGQASAVIVKFVRMGPKVFLLQPDMQHRAVNGSEDEKRDVADAFSQSVLYGFAPILWEGGKALVDLTPFLIRDAMHLGENIGSGRGNPGSAFAAAAAGGRDAASGGGYPLDESRSAVYPGNTKNFPKN